MVEQVRSGICHCFNNADSHNPLNIASVPARKSLLHAAAASGHDTTEIVEYLLEKNCFVNKVRILSAV